MVVLMMLLAPTSSLDIVDTDIVPPDVPKECVDCKNP
jgi:hypothetical protein